MEVVGVAMPVSRRRGANGKAPLQVYMDADLRDRLARAAFGEGVPASTVVGRAVQAELDKADTPPPAYDVPQAKWVELGPTAGWGAAGAPCPASADGATLEVVHVGDEGWHWFATAAGARLAGGIAFRSLTACMLEAERAVAVLTAEQAKAEMKRAARKRRKTASAHS